MMDRKEELEHCVNLVRKAGFATGHADTVEELVAEVLVQAKEARNKAVDWKRRYHVLLAGGG